MSATMGTEWAVNDAKVANWFDLVFHHVSAIFPPSSMCHCYFCHLFIPPSLPPFRPRDRNLRAEWTLDLPLQQSTLSTLITYINVSKEKTVSASEKQNSADSPAFVWPWHKSTTKQSGDCCRTNSTIKERNCHSCLIALNHSPDTKRDDDEDMNSFQSREMCKWSLQRS